MKRTHFIGMNGIGMSSLAHILLQKKQMVSGSDAKVGENAKQLAQLGAQTFEGHDAQHVDGATTVVYSSAIREDNIEYAVAKRRGCQMLHRSDLLNELTRGYQPILVAGTHGKTTTSAMVAHVLEKGGFDPSYVIGGRVPSLATHGQLGKSPYFVVEADESDGSFLKTRSKHAIVTNVEPDHLDFWGTFEKLRAAFFQFQEQCENALIYHESCPFEGGICYGTSDQCDTQLIKRGPTFDVRFGESLLTGFKTPLVGDHNLLNATAAIALLLQLGVNVEIIRTHMATFESVKRRLEHVKQIEGVDFYDDYAHHPTEIEATYRALKQFAKGRRLVTLVQPHRYSRVKSFFDAFRKVYASIDHLVLLPIYSAGEKEDPTLFEALSNGFNVVDRDQIDAYLKDELKEGDIVLTMGAGDVTQIGRDYV